MAYWLFKSEPDCFSIDHLKAAKNGTAPWDGVRNYQARNCLRDQVKVGDKVLFHHSSVNPPGIIGTCEVVKGGYPDHTAQDPKSDHFDPKSTKENPIWYMVDVKFLKKFDELIPIGKLKTVPGLEKMMVIQKGSRLSIQPVTEKEWKVVLKLAGEKA